MVCLSALCTTIYETYMLNKYCYQHTSVYKCIQKNICSTYNLHIYISNDGLWFDIFPVIKRRKYQSRLSVCYFTRNGSDVSSITYKPTTSELVPLSLLSKLYHSFKQCHIGLYTGISKQNLNTALTFFQKSSYM